MTMITSKILVFLELFGLYSDCRGYNTLPPIHIAECKWNRGNLITYHPGNRLN